MKTCNIILKPGINPQLTLREGKQTRVHFEGNTRVYDKKLRAVVTLSSAEDLRQEWLEDHVQALIAYYKERGFHFVTGSSRQAEDEQTHTLTFVIEEGPRVHVRAITIAGNVALTKDSSPAGCIGKRFSRKTYWRFRPCISSMATLTLR
jgi:outer membrane protein assembly factor BamA